MSIYTEKSQCFEGNVQSGTDRHESRTTENPVSTSVAREEEQTPDSFPQHIKSIISRPLESL